ncbi:MFS general substrate transporter [Daldinia caldariorum]|uniref:MFS general substrate transporter n=1 Tax=Daldinia caldariorum TaxID=326644 RepID=UPI0020075830|nr:MFS general substrate transporter [Daldinia caldariorum]KAI1463459.1 MFS general substrate transporter [Daldinia caldariorum]
MTSISPAEMAASTGRDVEKDLYSVQPPAEVLEGSKTVSDNESADMQEGVKRVEAITTVWSDKSLWSTFALLWLVSFVSALLSSIDTSLSPYVTSSFSKHGLLAVINIAARVIGGVVTLSLGKIIDIRGRMEGFVGSLLLITVGMIMKATCRNVEVYAAAQVFTWVGNVALGFVIDVFVADITTLKNRMLIFALNSTPNLATTFAGPRIAELFYQNINFRWAFGAFTIILLGVSLPVVAILYYHERKAKKLGLLRPKSGRTPIQSILHYIIEFDLIGAILISAGFTLILLPFSLVSSASHSWKSARVIVMIVMGVVSLAAFAIWEKLFARVKFFPFEFLKDRTFLGAVLAYFVVFMTTFIWDAYYSSYLQVVHGLSISIANYVLNAYSLTSYFTGPFIALYIRYTGHVRYPALAAIPIYLLGTALIIYFRVPGAQVGYLAMCQVLVGFGVGVINQMSQLITMASVRHQDVAVALAIYGLFGSVGSSVGYAVAGGIWTNILPVKLYEFLPDDSKNMTATIYGDINKQMEYPIGTPIRDAVIEAYGDVMRKMVIVGSALIPLTIICVIVWRNINVKKLETVEKRSRGNVF